MKKIIAQDSDRNRFYIEYIDSAPKERKFHLTGIGVDIKAPSIPQAVKLLREQMNAQGRLIVSYESLDSATIIK